MKKTVKLFPLLLLIPLIAAGLVFCGGGGDGDGECTDTFVSGTYNFQLFLRSSDLTVQIDTDTVTITDVFFNGTVNTDTGEFTVDNNSSIDGDTGAGFFGVYSADVTQTIRVPEGAEPTEGQVDILIGSDKITVTVDDTIPGVTVDLDTGNNGTVDDSVDVAWNIFDIDEPSIPAYAQQAAFAFGSSGFILEQAELILEAAQVIDENELAFIPNVTLPITCDTFSPLTPPAGVSVDPGSADFTWDDFVSDGEINTGDNFAVELNQCWQNETADLDDTFLDGTLNLNDFFFGGADDSCRILGFAFDNVQYVNLDISDTVTDTLAGTVTIDTTLRVNGTVSLSLFF
jgi:hypothetical protein